MINKLFSFIEHLQISDRFVLKLLVIIFVVSLGVVLYNINKNHLIEIPFSGGELTEGIVGTPRFVNPILAVTGADRDVVSLVYSGLMRLGNDGTLTEDLAGSLTISDDGLTYNITLRENARFHDDTQVTSDDVIFTITRMQDPAIKSPFRASWDGVELERISDREFNIVLPQAYAPFIENLTVGILPKHKWEFATSEEFPFSQYNSEPIGSGPYKLAKIERNASGIPQSYTLEVYDDFYGNRPEIENLLLNFYPNEERLVEAFLAGEVHAAASLSQEALGSLPQSEVPYESYTTPLPRTFAVFFNQNEAPVFRDKAVRKALDMVVDRDQIVEEVFGGYAETITSPIPPGFNLTVPTSTNATSSLAVFDAARDVLRDAAWKLNEESGRWEKKSGDTSIELSFSIETVNTPEFQQIANILKTSWEELGAVVDIKQFEQSDLTQSVIRPRQYNALLFGTDVGRELDFYSFWHSSQRNDPGLNVALYANITTDSILAEARTTNNFADREEAYTRFVEEVAIETPAIFLFVPAFTYVVTPNITGISLEGAAHPSERFSGIGDWYTETESVWKIFSNN